MTREEILDKAKKIVNGGRSYGDPEDNFERIARMWSHYHGTDFSAKDVAVMMILLKIARITTGEPKADNWIDIAGYAACGGEIQTDTCVGEIPKDIIQSISADADALIEALTVENERLKDKYERKTSLWNEVEE